MSSEFFLKIREFEKADASFCCEVRRKAIAVIFFKYLDPDIVKAALNAYTPETYLKLNEDIGIFIIEDGEENAGFITLKKIDDETFEIPQIYIDPKYHGKGFGTQTMQFIEDLIKDTWPEAKKINLNTIVPEYNGAFYKKLGFEEKGLYPFSYPDVELKAMRFEKDI